MSANPREIAILVLGNDLKIPGFIEDILNKYLCDCNLYGKDRSLARELTLGVIRWRLPLEWLAERKLRSRPPETVMNILMLGLYQLFWMDRIPLHAAVFETVKLCDVLEVGGYKKLVNAILRAYGREGERTLAMLDELRRSDPALACSHPEWLYLRLKEQLGAEEALRLMDWDNSIPGPMLRTNALLTARDALLKELQFHYADAVAVDYPFLSEQLMIKLPRTASPYQEICRQDPTVGTKFYIQDPATLLSVQMLDPQPGEVVLDSCAAPGGKTTYIAQRMKNQGHILAIDIVERLPLIRENCERLQVSIVDTQEVREFSKRPVAPEFDRILLDVPCSNTGVLRRRIEARYRLSAEGLRILKETQMNLLEEAAPRLKPGGVLCYSTCSITEDENLGQVEAFITRHPEFALQTSKLLLPHREKTDGAFVAILIKAK